LVPVLPPAHRRLRGGCWHRGLRPARQGAHDAGRGAQHVGDGHPPAAQVSRVQAERSEEDVDLHDGSLRSCGSRSRNFVSTVPARKSGWRSTRPRNGMVVVTPSMINESSAWRMRARASWRWLPCTMTLARRESQYGGTV